MTAHGDDVGETRAKGRPSLEEAAAINQAIRHAAIQELLARGEAATLNAVAKAAGLSRKTVYARYSSAADLFRTVVSDVLRSAGPVCFLAAQKVEDGLANYFSAVSAMLDQPHAHAFRQALTMNPETTTELQTELLAATRAIFYLPLLRYLESAQKLGELALQVDVAQMAKLGMTMIFGAEFLANHLMAPEESPDHGKPLKARLMARVLIHGADRAWEQY